MGMDVLIIVTLVVVVVLLLLLYFSVCVCVCFIFLKTFPLLLPSSLDLLLFSIPSLCLAGWRNKSVFTPLLSFSLVVICHSSSFIAGQA